MCLLISVFVQLIIVEDQTLSQVRVISQPIFGSSFIVSIIVMHICQFKYSHFSQNFQIHLSIEWFYSAVNAIQSERLHQNNPWALLLLHVDSSLFWVEIAYSSAISFFLSLYI